MTKGTERLIPALASGVSLAAGAAFGFDPQRVLWRAAVRKPAVVSFTADSTWHERNVINCEVSVGTKSTTAG